MLHQQQHRRREQDTIAQRHPYNLARHRRRTCLRRKTPQIPSLQHEKHPLLPSFLRVPQPQSRRPRRLCEPRKDSTHLILPMPLKSPFPHEIQTRTLSSGYGAPVVHMSLSTKQASRMFGKHINLPRHCARKLRSHPIRISPKS